MKPASTAAREAPIAAQLVRQRTQHLKIVLAAAESATAGHNDLCRRRSSGRSLWQSRDPPGLTWPLSAVLAMVSIDAEPPVADTASKPVVAP